MKKEEEERRVIMHTNLHCSHPEFLLNLGILSFCGLWFSSFSFNSVVKFSKEIGHKKTLPSVSSI